MTVADSIKFVRVVDAEGRRIDGFIDPVPSHWIGSDLLPEGTKEAPESDDDADTQDVDVLVARVAELEAENADLRKQLDEQATSGVEKPSGNASTEVWAKWAVEHGGASEDDVKGKSRDELIKAYGTPAS